VPPLHFARLRKEHRTLKQLVNQVIHPETHPPIPIAQIIQHNVCQLQGMDLLPGDIELYNDFLLATLVFSQAQQNRQDFEKTWVQFENTLVRGIFQPIIPTYDFILVDFPPGDYLLTRSSLIASDFYLIPARPEPLSVVGIGILEGHIKKLKQSDRSTIDLLGIVFSSLGHATNLAPRVKNRVSAEFGEANIFQTEIPMNVDVAKAVDHFQPVVLDNPSATGAKAFTELTKEFLARLPNPSR
jgi:cellulose biosynthesis protein BcsQ